VGKFWIPAKAHVRQLAEEAPGQEEGIGAVYSREDRRLRDDWQNFFAKSTTMSLALP